MVGDDIVKEDDSVGLRIPVEEGFGVGN